MNASNIVENHSWIALLWRVACGPQLYCLVESIAPWVREPLFDRSGSIEVEISDEMYSGTFVYEAEYALGPSRKRSLLMSSKSKADISECAYSWEVLSAMLRLRSDIKTWSNNFEGRGNIISNINSGPTVLRGEVQLGTTSRSIFGGGRPRALEHNTT